MKKILIAAATAGLLSLTACGGGETNNTVETAIENLEANAAMYDEMADNATNESTEAMFENAADAQENAADVLEDNAAATTNAM